MGSHTYEIRFVFPLIQFMAVSLLGQLKNLEGREGKVFFPYTVLMTVINGHKRYSMSQRLELSILSKNWLTSISGYFIFSLPQREILGMLLI